MAGGQTFHGVHDSSSGAEVAEYTFANGYMVIAPTRALLMVALHARSTGDSLGHSASFKALLPVDQNENYSAVAYQNLGPVLTPLLSQMSCPFVAPCVESCDSATVVVGPGV